MEVADRRLLGLRVLDRRGHLAGGRRHFRRARGYRHVRHHALTREGLDRDNDRPFLHRRAHEGHGCDPQPHGRKRARDHEGVIALPGMRLNAGCLTR